MNIRPYSGGDLEAVTSLFTASVHTLAVSAYTAEQRAAWAPRPPDLQRWQQRLACLQTFVAEVGSELSGFISFEPNGRIELVYCSPAFQRQGVASQLYGHVESYLRARGVVEFWTQASLVARPFFERQGFQVAQEQMVELGGVQLRRLAMRKSISAAQPALAADLPPAALAADD